ncbi:hypothetical protein EVC24_156 [Rhizobium phage RHph_I4]|nr:hypothetical protein EVC24_156 [Rhizobium phage RHph_I4]
MSYVNNYCIICNIGNDHRTMQELNQHLTDQGVERQHFLRLQGEGGTKGYEWTIFGMAANYVPLQEVITAMQKTAWDEPNTVILIFQEQNQYEGPTVIDWREGAGQIQERVRGEPVMPLPGQRKTRID